MSASTSNADRITGTSTSSGADGLASAFTSLNINKDKHEGDTGTETVDKPYNQDSGAGEDQYGSGYGWGDRTEKADEDKTKADWLNPKGDIGIKFCLDNKEAILDLHSSLAWTKVFELECDGCQRYYKHCMFSKAERKGFNGVTLCRWCQLDKSISTEMGQFCIFLHIHCNRGGKKECGLGSMSLIRPKPHVEAVIQENGLADLPPPEVEIKFVQKKMGQKAKKKMEREMRDLAGL